MPTIRPIAIALVIRDGYILVGESYDPVKDETFYRPLGGGIEYAEYGADALRRELREEMGAELLDVRYLETIENIFTVRGNLGHELVRTYSAALADPALYLADYRCRILDAPADSDDFICWQPLTRFRGNDATLYPAGLLALIDKYQLALLLAHRLLNSAHQDYLIRSDER